jgi:hypothetical protein
MSEGSYKSRGKTWKVRLSVPNRLRILYRNPLKSSTTLSQDKKSQRHSRGLCNVYAPLIFKVFYWNPLAVIEFYEFWTLKNFWSQISRDRIIIGYKNNENEKYLRNYKNSSKPKMWKNWRNAWNRRNWRNPRNSRSSKSRRYSRKTRNWGNPRHQSNSRNKRISTNSRYSKSSKNRQI